MLFLSYRKLLSYTIKSLRQDAHSREEEESRKRPRSARECAEAHSLFYKNWQSSVSVSLFFLEIMYRYDIMSEAKIYHARMRISISRRHIMCEAHDIITENV